MKLTAKEIVLEASLAEISEERLEQMIKDYAKRYCKEQREIYSKLIFPDISTMEDEIGNIFIKQDEIENISEPEFG